MAERIPYRPDEITHLIEFHREHGMEAGFTRVWDQGIDVTDNPPETWPWPWNPNRRPGH